MLYQLSYQGSSAGRGSNLQHKTIQDKGNLKPLCYSVCVSLLPQLYYHYNVVLQLKALYDEILRPELAEDENVPPSMDSGQAKKEKGKQAPAGGGGGKKEKERGESGGQDKKAKAVKEEPSVAAEGRKTHIRVIILKRLP